MERWRREGGRAREVFRWSMALGETRTTCGRVYGMSRFNLWQELSCSTTILI